MSTTVPKTPVPTGDAAPVRPRAGQRGRAQHDVLLSRGGSGEEWVRAFLADSRAIHLVLLGLPFLTILVVYGGLTRSYPVYQVGDEGIHYAIVHAVAARWPHLLLSGYGAWSGPLVYWLVAALSLPFGASRVAARLVVLGFSWATCAMTYVILRDRLRASPVEALALALMLGLSPFFFGESFSVLTDNPTWFFVVLALERLLAYAHEPKTQRLAAFALCAAAATTMRQVAVWLFIPACVAVLSAPLPRRRRLVDGAVLALGLVPLAALLTYWGGLLPPGTAAAGVPASLRLRNVLESLGVLGLWGLLLVPVGQIRSWRAGLGRRGVAAVAAAALLTVAALAGQAMGSLKGGDPDGMGIVAFVSSHYPAFAGTSLLWWLLVPLGAGVLVALLATRPGRPVDRVLVVSLVALLATTMANSAWYQRYVDFPILLLLCALAVTARSRFRWADRGRWVAVVGISLAWAVAYMLNAGAGG
jgi:Dolichyl-phosphate-mannose-protein mannosyltransferase